MGKKILGLIGGLLLLAGGSHAQSGAFRSPVSGGVPTTTIAKLPSSPTKGTVYSVTDGSTTSDCTTGGGTNTVLCSYSGIAWAAVAGLPAGPTSPNGLAQTITSTPSGGVAGAGVYSLPGVVPRSVSGATSTDTIAATDCSPKYVQYTTTVNVAVTLPTATTLGVTNCTFKVSNKSATAGVTVTITPTTWTVNGAASFVLGSGQTAIIYTDGASGTNWIADPVYAPSAQNSAATNFGVALTAQTILLSAPTTGEVIVAVTTVQSLAGVGCSTATNSVTPTLSFTAPGGAVQTAALGTMNITGNGVVDNGDGSGNAQMFAVKTGTSVTYTTTSTLASTGCTTTPQYTVYGKAIY